MLHAFFQNRGEVPRGGIALRVRAESALAAKSRRGSRESANGEHATHPSLPARSRSGHTSCPSRSSRARRRLSHLGTRRGRRLVSLFASHLVMPLVERSAGQFAEWSRVRSGVRSVVRLDILRGFACLSLLVLLAACETELFRAVPRTRSQ